MELYKSFLYFFRKYLKEGKNNYDDSSNLDLNFEVYTINKNMGTNIEYYLNEIIRKLNSINFILKKTNRSLKHKELVRNFPEELLIILIFQFFYEKKSRLKIFENLNQEFPNEDYPLKLKEFFQKLQTFSWKAALKGKIWQEKMSLRISNSTFLIKKLENYLDPKDIRENLVAMDSLVKSGDFTFRIRNFPITKSESYSNNDLRISIQNDLQNERIQFYPDSDLPFIFHTTNQNKADLLRSRQNAAGNIIIQDKASVAAVYFLDPQQNDYICDLCAAPGMKTELINEITDGKSFIIANDYSYNRLKNMKQLIYRNNNLEFINMQQTNFDGFHFPIRSIPTKKIFDRILIDAPCTGSGTFGANPELKWRQNQKFLNRNVFLQEKLLGEGLRLLKTGGILLYSTCSLYAEEGELQIQKISDNIKRIPLDKWISPPYKIKDIDPTGMGRFFPNIHGTNGFFIAKLQKR